MVAGANPLAPVALEPEHGLVTTRPDSVQTQDDSTAPGDLRPQGPGEEEPAAADDDQPRLTVAAVARRLGVAPATLRTWDRRYGLGPSDHASGQHRRYAVADLARLEQMQRALLRGASPAEAARYAHATTQQNLVAGDRDPASDTGQIVESGPVLVSGVLDEDDASTWDEGSAHPGGGGLRLGGAGPRTRGLGRAVLALDSGAAQRLMVEAMEADGVVETWNEVVLPVLRATSERRQRSGSGVEAVQLLADSVSTALRGVIANAPAPVSPRPVVLASVPGEGQEAELLVLAAALASKKVAHRLFAPALPKEGLEAAVRRTSPTAVVLWSEQSAYADPALLSEIPNTRLRVRAFTAGSGWDGCAVPAQVEFLGSVATAVEVLSELALS